MKVKKVRRPRLPRARSSQRSRETVEDVSLAAREHVTWPLADWLLGLSDVGRVALATAAALAITLVIGASSLFGGGSSTKQVSTVAAAPEPAPATVVTLPKAKAKAKPEPTLHGAAPVFKPAQGQEKVGASKGVEAAAASTATAANTGNPATDTIASSPAAARPTDAAASSAQSADVPDGPPAGPAAIAVARKFANAFLVYETGGDETTVREAFAATATPELTKALMRRPPRQPAGIEVPKAKVLNIVPAPSHGTIYPLSVSLLRVGVTSELRLELEQLKNEGWRVTNVLG
jgi:hypothetical protein